MKRILIILLAFLLVGCQQYLEHNERELRDHAKSQQIFKNTLSVRTNQIGVSVGYFGRDRITQENNELIDEYITAAIAADPNNKVYFENAKTFGIGLRLYENMWRQLLLEIQGYWR